ncbi:MAG: elongation factor P [Chloroflexi bacterium]|nr:elongation factor P [Chloroflexota bacterium]
MATMIPALEISRGTILEIDGQLFTILEYQQYKAGKGNSEARMRMKLRNVATGATTEKVYRTDDKVPKAVVESRAGTFLYADGDMYHFMDGETYEEKAIPSELLGESVKFLQDGMPVEMVVYKERPISVTLPITVDLKIVEAEPGFKGDTAAGGGKKAKTATGLTVDVPLFVNVGDTVKVDTRTGTYISRI